MDSNSLMFLPVMMVIGGLVVTLFFYGGHFVLRLLETPDRAQAPGYGPTVTVHPDSSPGASTLSRADAAGSPGVLRV